MAGKFAGWLIYLPALLNWVSTFQNSMGGSNMISVMLQDCIFLVAWFLIRMKCPSCSVWTILYLGLHFKSHLPGCLFLKYSWSPTWKAGFSCAMVFWAVLNLFSPNVFFAIANANLCVSRVSIPESGSPRKHCMGSNSWCRRGWGLFHIPRRMVFLQLPNLELSCSWQVLGLNTCPSSWDLFHKVSLMWVSGIFVEDFKLAITLWMVWCWEYPVNFKLL